MSRPASSRAAPTRLSQAILDRAGCDEPDCTHDHSIIHLQPRCHPQAGMSVAYHKATGSLDIRCRKCNQPAAVIGVAPT